MEELQKVKNGDATPKHVCDVVIKTDALHYHRFNVIRTPDVIKRRK